MQGQIDAIIGIKAQSVEPMVRCQGLMRLLNHSTDPAQRGELLQQALAEAEKLGPGREQEETLEIFAARKRELPMNEKVFGPGSVEVAHNYEGLAMVYRVQNKLDQQESSLRQAITILEKLPKASVHLSTLTQTLGDFYVRQKKYPEAETAYLQSFHAAELSPPEVMLTGAAQRLGPLTTLGISPNKLSLTTFAQWSLRRRTRPRFM